MKRPVPLQQDSGWCCCGGVSVMVDEETSTFTARQWLVLLCGCVCDGG